MMKQKTSDCHYE